MSDSISEDKRQVAVTFMTTEHFALQGARGLTISESNGRAGLFLSSLSSALVALGFAAQASDFGQSFNVFALLILPPIAFLGFVTFQRAVQSGIEDETYSREINRIRHFYVDMVPELRPYFSQPTTDDGINAVVIRSRMGRRWQPFLTIASVVGVMNSVVIGAITGLAVNVLTRPPIAVPLTLGVIVTLGMVAVHAWYQSREWKQDELANPAMFPHEGSALQP